jgi:hypothetical protein
MVLMMTVNENPDELLGKDPNEYLRPSEAAKYLGQKWGRPFTAKDFLNLRTNREDFTIEPDIDADQMTLWKRSTLDKIAETISPPEYRPKTHGVPRRKRKKQ